MKVTHLEVFLRVVFVVGLANGLIEIATNRGRALFTALWFVIIGACAFYIVANTIVLSRSTTKTTVKEYVVGNAFAAIMILVAALFLCVFK